MDGAVDHGTRRECREWMGSPRRHFGDPQDTGPVSDNDHHAHDSRALLPGALLDRSGGCGSGALLAGCQRFPRIPDDGPAVRVADPDITRAIESILEKRKIPGMAAGIVDTHGLVALGVGGVRARGNPAKIQANDRFHLGSCTKSMNATMIATLVEEGKLSWGTTVGEAFPTLRDGMDPAWRGVTLEQLLTNRSGAPNQMNADGLWGELASFAGSPTDARLALVEGITKNPPEAPPAASSSIRTPASRSRGDGRVDHQDSLGGSDAPADLRAARDDDCGIRRPRPCRHGRRAARTPPTIAGRSRPWGRQPRGDQPRGASPLLDRRLGEICGVASAGRRGRWPDCQRS